MTTSPPTPGTNLSPELITRWPVQVTQDYDQAALLCHAWVENPYRGLHDRRVVRCRTDILGDTLEEIARELATHIRNIRHVPPPEPYARNWNGHGVWDPPVTSEENGES